MIILTLHAEQRFIERFSIDKGSALSLCVDSVEHGVDVLHEEMFKVHMRYNAEKHGNDAVYRWKNYLVFFTGVKVTTVWPLEWLKVS